MLKKAICGSLAVKLLAGFLFGRDVFSYANTACRNVQQAVKSEITPEFELDRIRNEIENLLPEIRQHMAIVAEQSVDLKDKQRDIEEKQAKLEKQKDAILALRSDLSSGADSFTYRQVSYTRGEVESDLATRFESFRVGEEALDRDRQILDAHRQTLQANQKKLDEYLGVKQTLAVKVSQLEARLKTIQATEAVNRIQFDDSRLSRVDEMIGDLNHALDVRESLIETEGNTLGRIPVEEDAAEIHTDVVAEIDSHFGLEDNDGVVTVSADSSL